jgi:hypothetical protein
VANFVKINSLLKLCHLCLFLGNCLLETTLPLIVVEHLHLLTYNGTVPVGQLLSPHITHLSFGACKDQKHSFLYQIPCTHDVFADLFSRVQGGQESLRLKAVKFTDFRWPLIEKGSKFQLPNNFCKRMTIHACEFSKYSITFVDHTDHDMNSNYILVSSQLVLFLFCRFNATA